MRLYKNKILKNYSKKIASAYATDDTPKPTQVAFFDCLI